jgi:carbohydrate diacid regulator
VGITGDPNEVRKLAVILKEMVELILSEIEFMNIKSLESKVEVAYLKELLSKKEITPEFAKRGKLLGIDLELSRVCLIIEILDFKKIIKRYSDKYKDTYERELALQTFKNDFEEYIRKYCSIKDKVFHLEEDVFIVLKEYHGSFLIINKFVEMITEKLEREFSTKTLIAIGEPVETSRDIAFSYRTAKTTMKILNKIKNNSNYLFATDYKIHSLVIDNLDTIRNKLKYQLEVIASIKNWDGLKITLEKYIQNNMNILKTSKDLGIHRNTVLTRLEKIKESLSLDPFNLEDCFILKLLLILEDFY